MWMDLDIAQNYVLFLERYGVDRDLHVRTHSFPTRRSSDLGVMQMPSGAANRRDMAAMSVRQWCWAIWPEKAWQRHGNQHERGRGARAIPAAPRPRERGSARDAGRTIDDGCGDALSGRR